MRWEQYRKTPDIYLQLCRCLYACTRAPQVRQSLMRILSLPLLCSSWPCTRKQTLFSVASRHSLRSFLWITDPQSDAICNSSKHMTKGERISSSPRTSWLCGQKWFTNRVVATIYTPWRSALPVGWVVCGLEAASFLAFLLERVTECAMYSPHCTCVTARQTPDSFWEPLVSG